MKPLTQAWLLHDKVTRNFLAEVPAEGWLSKVAGSKAVHAQFAHIHNVRLMWLKAIDPASIEGLQKLTDSASQEEARDSLKLSAERIAQVIEQAGERVKGFKPTTEAFVLYLVSHEANHRAMAELALRQAGQPVSERAAYAQWEWGPRVAELEAED